MLIKITFKDLVNCNPINNSYPPMTSLRMQNTEIIIPEETFRKIEDGYTVILEVKQRRWRGPLLEFETIAGRFSSVKFQIDPNLISEIKEIV